MFALYPTFYESWTF